MDRRKAEVADVIRTTSFIQENIPVGPAHSAVVEIVNHRPAVLFAKLPIGQSLAVEYVNTTFSEDQRHVGKRLMDKSDVLKHRLTSAPGLIPVKTDAPNKPGGFWIAEDGTGALEDEVAIVVPGNNFFVC